MQEYVPDWISIAGPVAEAAGIVGRDGPVSLQGAAFAGQGFTPREIFALGILDSEPGKAISMCAYLLPLSASIRRLALQHFPAPILGCVLQWRRLSADVVYEQDVCERQLDGL